MQFLVTYKISPGTRDVAQQRFKSTGGPPPAGVTMVGRWHCVDGSGGAVVAETNDATALARWIQEWTDVITFDVRPVLNDEQMAGVIG